MNLLRFIQVLLWQEHYLSMHIFKGAILGHSLWLLHKVDC